LKDSDPDVRRQAALALRDDIPAETIDPVLQALGAAIKDPDQQVRGQAVRALAAIGGRALPAELRDDRGDRRLRLSTGIGERAVRSVLEAMRDNDAQVRAAAANGLGQVKDPGDRVVLALMKSLRDETSHVRRAAADALAEIGPGARMALPALSKLVDDQETGVRWGAVRAVGIVGIGMETAAPPLVHALKDQDPAVRLRAVRALRDLGVSVKGAIPPLRSALRDEDPGVQMGAALLLWRDDHNRAQGVLPVLIAALRLRSCEQEAAKILKEMASDAGLGAAAVLNAIWAGLIDAALFQPAFDATDVEAAGEIKG
jgi:HEAT repeat protein